MEKPTIHPATGYCDEIAHVAKYIRQEDEDELWALSRDTPRGAIKASAEMSDELYFAMHRGAPIAVLGAATNCTALGGRGVPWLLGTRGMDACPNEIISYARAFTDHLLETCDVLENIASVDNRKTLVFLSRIGFAISEPFEMPTGAMAVTFRKERR